MSIVTKTGDNGETGLVGGSRIPKSDVRLHAYGTVDELNATLGMVLAEPGLPPPLKDQLTEVQHLLFRLGADLASPMDVKNTKRIEAVHTKELEEWIAHLEETLPPLTFFILPGGSKAGSALHLARTVCRRAERRAVALSQTSSAGVRPADEVSPQALIFLNRLGDYLFLAARYANRKASIKEVGVEY
ncbi:MAG: cob(I)yrinic acid a,c-diamide adenosyltransferase [Patescibacteria group bacterium]